MMYFSLWGFPGGAAVKHPPANTGDKFDPLSPGGSSGERNMACSRTILASGKLPGTEEWPAFFGQGVAEQKGLNNPVNIPPYTISISLLFLATQQTTSSYINSTW